MRKNAGRLLEIPIFIAFAAILSAILGPRWKPWGFFAGPALLALIFGHIMITGMIADMKQRRALARLMELAGRRGTVPPWPELKELVEMARVPHDISLRAAAERDHPAREAFALALRWTSPRDPESFQVLSDFVRDRPDAPASGFVADYVIDYAPAAMGLETARAALDGNHETLAAAAARSLVFRGTSEWKEGHAEFAALVRERRTRIESLLTDEVARGHFRKL